MSQRIKKEIDRLCRSSLYPVAVRLCAAIRNRVYSSRQNGRERTGVAFCLRQFNMTATPQAAGKAGARVCLFFGRAINSLQSRRIQAVGGGEFFAYRYEWASIENIVKGKTLNTISIRQSIMHKRSHKTGFDLLRITQNLARGNLESQGDGSGYIGLWRGIVSTG